MAGDGPDVFAELSFAEVYGLIDRVANFYGYHGWGDIEPGDESRPWHWAPPTAQPDEVRIHSDTVGYRELHRLPVLAVTLTDEEIGNQWGPAPDVSRKLRRMASASLLYADSVVVIDPFTFHIDGGFGEEEEEAAYFRAHFHRSALLLEQARPLIEAGVVILAPDPGAFRHQDEDVELACQLLGVETPTRGKAPSAVSRLAGAIYGLRVATLTDAILTTDDSDTWRDIARALDAQRAASDIHVSVAAGLATLELPFLGGLSVPTLLDVRNDEDAFAEWRAQLRMATRLLKYDPSDEVFAKEAAEILKDLLVPQAAAVRRATSRSAALQSALRNEPFTLGVGGLATGAGAAALGLPIAGVVVSALGGSLARVAAAGARPPMPTGAAKVMFELLR